MRAEVAAWCREEALFTAGDRVLCALSGGADSTAMLWCLHSLREELGITVAAAHFNHRLRGEESDRDEAFVREFCKAHGIPLTVGSAEVAQYAKTHGQTLEEAARECRYAFLQSLPCDKLATAHTADDNAETVLLHLLRGSGLRGLCGIPPKRGNVVRPLLSVTRAQIVAYLQAEGIAWVEDSTNTEEFCTRNRLRRRVMPALYALSPRLSERLTTQSRLLREEDAYLDSLAAALLQEKNGVYARAPLLAAPEVLQRRALRLMARRVLPQDVSFAHIDAMRRILASENPSAQCALPQGFVARRRYDGMELVRETEEAFPITALQIPGETVIPVLGMKITCEIAENFKKIANTPFRFAVKYDMITQSILQVRSRRRGDRMSVDGVHSKTLKKLFIERRIPRAERDRTAVLASGDAVLAVAGIGADLRYTPAAGEPAAILQIEFQ